MKDNNTKDRLNLSSIMSLRTSNRFKKINKNKEETNIIEIFDNKQVNNKEEINISFFEDLNKTLADYSSSNVNNLSPISLYSESVKSNDEEIPELLKIKNHVLDTGLKSEHSSPISKLFFKIWKSNSGSTSCKKMNLSPSSLLLASSSSSSSSPSSLSLSSPYSHIETSEKINQLIEKIEKIDNLKPNYFTGCLIIHCKILKKLFNETYNKNKTIKRKGFNKDYLQNWKVAISSIELFIDGLNDGLILIKENQNKSEGKGEVLKYENIYIKKQEFNNEIEKEEIQDNKYNNKEVPDKYKISIRKELYSYQDKETNKEDNELDLFLTQLNNKLRKVNQMQIL